MAGNCNFQGTATWTELRTEKESLTNETKTYPYTDPCEAWQFAERQNQKGLIDPYGLGPFHDEVLRLFAECNCIKQQQGEPLPAQHVPDPQNAAEKKPDGPPVGGDTPQEQGAPYVPIVAELTIDLRPQPARTTRLSALYEAYRPEPTPIEWIPLQMDPPPASSDEHAKIIDDILKGKEPDKERNPLHSRQTTRNPVKDGDPVDLFSGRLAIAEVDFDVPTPFIPIRLVRTYRSGLPYFGPWGFNWDHNYNVYLRELKDGGVALWTGRMHENYFRWTGESFEPDYGIHERLERLTPQIYQLRRAGGVTLYFSYPTNWTNLERIPLVEIRDRHGNQQFLTYDDQNRLHRVHDEAGRGLHFHYGTCGLLECVEDHSGTQQREYWHHSEIEQLIAVKTPLTGAYPHGAATGYEYDFLNDHPAMQHNIVRVVDAEGQIYLQNEYGGPETGWGFNRVRRQLYGDFLFEFDYEQLQSVPENPAYVDVLAMRTAVHPPDGSLHTYTFNYRGDMIDYRFRLNRDGSYRIVDYQWKYDEQGNIERETGPGGESRFEYDYQNSNPCARGNLLKVERRAALSDLTGSRIVSKTSYHTEFQLPLEIQDENQNSTRFIYDTAPPATGKLARIELPKVTLPNGAPQQSIIRFETNSQGQVTATISAENIRNETHYFSNQQPLLAGFVRETIQDAGQIAYKIEYDYDSAGYLKQVIKPPGISTQLSYNKLGQLEEVTLPSVSGLVARVRMSFTLEGNPLQVERPRGAYTDSVITGDSIVDRYVLNALGQVQEIVVGTNTALPRITRFCRDHEGRPIKVIDPMGVHIHRCFDERGLLLSETLGAGTTQTLTTHFTYERDGRLRRIQEPNGQITEVEQWDLWQRPLQTRFSNGSIQKLIWENPDRVREIYVEGNPGDGSAIRTLSHNGFDYDERGRLIREKYYVFQNDPSLAVELVTTYLYDADDRLREIQLPRGGVLKYEYDGLARLIRTEDMFGNVESAVYDTAGNIRTVLREEMELSGARTTIWQFEHDERDRLKKATLPGGAVMLFSYDDRDLLVERQEPLNIIYRSRYGLLGELQETLLDPGALAIKSEYGYDLLGRLKYCVDPTGEVTQWQRDALGRIIAIALPDGSVWQQAYNSAGQLVERTTPSGSRFIHTYKHDSGYLMNIECIPGEHTVGVPKHEFDYDGLGRLVRAAVPGQSITRQYDSLGRVLRESSQGKSVQLVYDDLAGTFDLLYPDGRREHTTRDLGGRPIQVSLLSPGVLGGTLGDTLAQFVYAGLDRLHAISYSNGVTTSLAYDDAHRLIRIDHTRGGQMLESCRYRYDERNRRRLMQLLGSPQVNRLHEFDARDRLIQASWDFPLTPLDDALNQQDHDADISVAEQAKIAAQRKEIFRLDPADSREQYTDEEEDNVSITAYSYAPGHKLANVGSDIINYHADGPRAKDGDHLYEVDALGRVVRIRDAATSVVKAEFSYDAFSRPIVSQLNGVSFQRWFIGTRWLHEEDGNNEVQRQLTPHPLWPLPLQQRMIAGEFTPHPDGAFSSICLTDQSGAVAERTRFETFGAPSRFAADGLSSLPVSTAVMRPAFGGMAYQAELGLYESSMRLYDPKHGLFIAREPFLYIDSPSPYLYTLHNPIDFIDPIGDEKKRLSEPETDVWDYAKGAIALPILAFGLLLNLFSGGEGTANAPRKGEKTTPQLSAMDRTTNIAPLFIGGGAAASAGRFFTPGVSKFVAQGAIAGGSYESSGLAIQDVRRGEVSGTTEYLEGTGQGLFFGGLTGGGLFVIHHGSAAALNLARGLPGRIRSWQLQKSVTPGTNEEIIYRTDMSEFFRAVSIANEKTQTALVDEVVTQRGMFPVASHFRNTTGLDRVYSNYAGTKVEVAELKVISGYRSNEIEKAFDRLLNTRYGLQGTQEYSINQALRIMNSPVATPEMRQTAVRILANPRHQRTLWVMDEYGNLQTYDMNFWELYLW